MSSQTLKMTSIACFVVCVILLFIAIERYSTNASNVQSMNDMGFGSLIGEELEPATPTAAKYALFFAVLAAGGGVTCLVLANRAGTTGADLSGRSTDS